MVFTATVSVLAAARGAPGAFAGGEGFVISSSDAPTIFSSRVDMGIVQILEGLDNITGVSPEVFAFSSWDGMSFVVRGVDLDLLRTVSPALYVRVAEEPIASKVGLAFLGERLADRLDLQVPCTIPLVGSYSAKVELVRVAGTFSSGSPLDDEMLTTLDVARYLSGTPATDASVIRVATSEPDWLRSLLSPEEARFTVFDLSLSKSAAAPGEDFVVGVKVRNWGGASGTAVVTFSEDGTAIREEVVALGPSSTKSIAFDHNGTDLGAREISCSLSGDFPVTLSSTVEIVEPYLVSSHPARVMLGAALEVRVTTHSGGPVPGVAVTLPSSPSVTNVTDQSGVCSLSAGEPGRFTLVFDLSDTPYEGMLVRGSSDQVTVLDPSSFPAGFLPKVTGLVVGPESVKQGEAAQATATVENEGSSSGTFELQVMVDSALHATLQVPLGPAEGRTVSFQISGLAPGTHVVQAGDFSASLDVVPWYADNPGLVELVIRHGGTSALSSAGSVPIYQAAKISEGNVALALFAIGAASALLAALATVSVFSKEVHEGRRRLGILRSIGASSGDIRRLVLPQALRASLVGASVGVASGLLVAVLVVGSGAFVVFGHALSLDIGLGPVLPILLASVAIALVSALASAGLAAKETAISSIRDLPGDEPPEKDLSELLGDG